MTMQIDDEGRANLQELYFHLEHHMHGNRNMAFYGQLRAEGKDHKEALDLTIEYFRLKEFDWYKLRLKDKARQDALRAERERRLEEDKAYEERRKK